MTWSDYLVEAIEPWLVRQWVSDYFDDVLLHAEAAGYFREPVADAVVRLRGRVHTITITGGFSR